MPCQVGTNLAMCSRRRKVCLVADQPELDTESSATSTWNTDGVDLAKALVSRAKAAAKNGPVPYRSQAGRGNSNRPGRRRGDRRSPGTGWSGPGDDERDPKAIGDVVDRMATEHGWDDDLAVHGVVARWPQIVGPDIGGHVEPLSYDEGVLTVRADSTAWATQMRMLAAQIVKRLNEEIGDGTVQRIAVLGPQSRSWQKGLRTVPGRGPRDTYG